MTSLLIGAILMWVLILVVGIYVPTEKERDAYAGGVAIGVLFMIVFAAYIASKHS